MALYNGPGVIQSMKKDDFEILRKYMCRICSQFAIGAQRCACDAMICSQCVEKRTLQQPKYRGKKLVVGAKPHLEHGPDFEDRKLCSGFINPLALDEYNEW